MHYYQFNIADYRKDTGHLSIVEHYIYRQLIDWYFLDEQPIPKLTQSVMRRLSLGSENVDCLKNVLDDFFIKEDDGWHHARIDADLARYHSNAEKNRVNGKKGGRPKKQQLTGNKKPKKTQPVNLANPTVTQSKGNQEPITNNHKPKRAGFTPPTVEMVSEYCSEKKFIVSAENFVDFYSAKGWMVGKNKMKDWKACVRTWQNRSKSESNEMPKGNYIN